MTVVREAAQVVHGDVYQTSSAGALQNPIVERAGKEVGKDRNDIEAHRR